QRGLQAQVRVVRTDKGTEFLNQTLHAYFAAEGIQHQTSVARTPEQNGQHSFYELIVNKARGKSGPLFHFDVHEDVRTIADATIEKDESHAGKVVERHWYEKNKHIFPASRWEIYDPTKKWERYTIHGD
nr:protein XAP5 circadian timekeeper [Tanacetum cinerariifolium]